MTQTESLIANLVGKFNKEGLEVIYAKCNGYPDPVEVQGAVPDIVAWDSNNELYHFGVVADNQSISDEETRSKMEILAKMMMSRGTSEGKLLPFYLGITPEASEQADKQIKEINPTSQSNIQKIII